MALVKRPQYKPSTGVNDSAVQTVFRDKNLLNYILRSGTPEMRSELRRLFEDRRKLRERAMKSAVYYPAGVLTNHYPPDQFYDNEKNIWNETISINGDPNPFSTYIDTYKVGRLIPEELLRALGVRNIIVAPASRRDQMARLNQIWWFLEEFRRLVKYDDLDETQKKAWDNMIEWMQSRPSDNCNYWTDFFPEFERLLEMQETIDSILANGGIGDDPDEGRVLRNVNKFWRQGLHDLIEDRKKEIADQKFSTS